ncbi:MAG: nucleotidyltransferase domain-containing protein [Lachnospiraceae bacterium]|nr:nucleotidyltransferase domain-containing protein [Candidatus Colinaster equi]
MRDIIIEKLKEIEEKENVRIIAAIESGSRAWGFESPNSDYDVRFIYVRTLEDYLKLEKTKDVIEWQLDDVLDINGWDLKKALQLMHDSNPSIFEWCASPIIYRDSESFKELKALRQEYYSRKKNLYHYWHMANNNNQAYLQGEEVRIKKYFYVIRPLLAAKWVVDKKTHPQCFFLRY